MFSCLKQRDMSAEVLDESLHWYRKPFRPFVMGIGIVGDYQIWNIQNGYLWSVER